ncbi:uncharacterized protein SAPINGB_P005066 [Magnusiomyces paraingens]|uniref:Dipeptidyl-peptidase IV n=1 Tax=Magnusiomyces paraingens TaxID=2606893 RepID=A0A5E8BY94_9ASCO|nr:uncharacterized protein SAPINGB_P005066 [Saprochaete ingens]VVT56454.1 unnamed protein product [Saprochaete ingens]
MTVAGDNPYQSLDAAEQHPSSTSTTVKPTSNESDRSTISSILEEINDHAEKISTSRARTTPSSGIHRDSHDDFEDLDFERAGGLPNDDDEFDDTAADDKAGFLGTTPKNNKKKQASRRRTFLMLATGLILFLLLGFFMLYAIRNAPASTSSSSSSSTTTTTPETTSDAPTTEKTLSGPGLSQPQIDSDKKLFLMNTWRTGALRADFESLEWVPPAPGSSDVLLLEESIDGFALVNWPDRSSRKIIFTSDQRSFLFEKDVFLVSRLLLSPDQKYAILVANQIKNYRHSSFANYFLYNIETKFTEPLYPGHHSSKIAVSRWSPASDKVAFVLDNNLYIRDITSQNVDQITKDGGTELFYGRPDWVYEEEVFGADFALWWSPKGDYLAYLRTNDSAVEEFPIPYFVQKSPASSHPYPKVRKIKYPKPGTPNPVVDLLLLDVNSQESYHVPVEKNDEEDLEKLITEVVWTGDSKAVLRISDRDSSVLRVGVIDAEKRTGNVSRRVDVGKNSGWFEISQNTHFIPADPEKGRPDDGYIDMNVIDGYNHLVYYSPIDSGEPKVILTSGPWEVDDAQVAFNPKTNRVYFTATKKSSIERHVYSVKLDGTDLKAITDESKDGWYDASYSPNSKYVVLNYMGPEVPWQVVLDLEADDIWGSAVHLQENDKLKEKLKEYELPTRIFSKVKVAEDNDGNDIFANAVEYRPPGFNESLQYPVLFYVYGGPVSQLVQKIFSYSFQHVVSSSLNAVVVTVDGRGTGFRGRDFRSVVRGHLGRYEAQDQITAAKEWAAKPYVDSERLAIWGWSYGGFMTLKTLETDGGETFSYGMAVAPVTDWRFYDSIYTERYMRLPGPNKAGYDESAITNVKNIAKNTRFLVMHGSGDDNVHFQHTLTLLDKFDLAGVERYDMHVFPDSDHSIFYHGANTIVYDKLLHWIGDAFSGKFLTLLKKRSEI